MRSKRHYSDWIQTYLDNVRGATEAPDHFHYWSSVATIGAAVTRHVYIDELQYRFYPNWIIVLAALPGRAKKSTTMDQCLDLLRDIHPELFGADETNWPDICKRFGENTQYDSDEESDMLEGEYDSQCALTFTLGEFGTFLNTDDDHAITGITRLWDCPRKFEKSTKHNGIDNIQNPFFNLIGCTTAKWLKDNFGRYQGWGIASRIIFVHSEAASKPIWSPRRNMKPNEWTRTRQKLREDLAHIMTLRGECTFTDDAVDLAKDWYDKTFEFLGTYATSLDADPWLCDFLARKQVHAHKLAMTLSIARRDNLTINAIDYQEAIDKIEEVEKELKRVFRSYLIPSESSDNERAILDKIIMEMNNGLGGEAPRAVLLRSISRYTDGSTAERILTSFIRRGLLCETLSKSGVMITTPKES